MRLTKMVCNFSPVSEAGGWLSVLRSSFTFSPSERRLNVVQFGELVPFSLDTLQQCYYSMCTVFNFGSRLFECVVYLWCVCLNIQSPSKCFGHWTKKPNLCRLSQVYFHYIFKYHFVPLNEEYVEILCFKVQNCIL